MTDDEVQALVNEIKEHMAEQAAVVFADMFLFGDDLDPVSRERHVRRFWPGAADDDPKILEARNVPPARLRTREEQSR